MVKIELAYINRDDAYDDHKENNVQTDLTFLEDGKHLSSSDEYLASPTDLVQKSSLERSNNKLNEDGTFGLDPDCLIIDDDRCSFNPI